MKDLQGTLTKAKASGAAVLVEPYTTDGRSEAMRTIPRRIYCGDSRDCTEVRGAMAFLLKYLYLRREWAAGLLCFAAPQMAWADDQKSQASTPQRPAIMFNRWQEDWSVLADPRVSREPFDELKYIPLSGFDPHTYLSFGANTRERFESNNAPNFGTGSNRSQNYVISRNEFHADLRVDNQLQAFVQFQADYAPWKTMLTPVDRDRLDLEQAWVALTEQVGGGTLKLRAGRQQFGFDLQRFVAVRDGPNVRQSFDAAWADYENGPWRFITFYSLPVQVRDVTIFDDYSSVSAQTFGMARTSINFPNPCLSPATMPISRRRTRGLQMRPATSEETF